MMYPKNSATVIINGSTRANSQTTEICELIKKSLKTADYASLEGFTTIPDEYLKGSPEIDKMGLSIYDNFIMVVPSYYVLPSPVFTNFINMFSPEDIRKTFSGKFIYLISVQSGDNLNEIHVDSIRRYFNKIFHWNKIENCRLCTDFCMVNESPEVRQRMLLTLIKRFDNTSDYLR